VTDIAEPAGGLTVEERLAHWKPSC
jgi:hypothetical protein